MLLVDNFAWFSPRSGFKETHFYHVFNHFLVDNQSNEKLHYIFWHFCFNIKWVEHIYTFHCITHLSAEDMLKSAVIEEKKFKHSPRVGADNPLGPKNLCQQEVGWLCWGLTSQSTIFQSCRDGAIASWVINQYFRGVKCLAQGHNTAAVGLEPRTSRSESDTLRLTHRAPRQQEGLITMVICWKFEKNLFNLWLYTHLFMI